MFRGEFFPDSWEREYRQPGDGDCSAEGDGQVLVVAELYMILPCSSNAVCYPCIVKNCWKKFLSELLHELDFEKKTEFRKR